VIDIGSGRLVPVLTAECRFGGTLHASAQSRRAEDTDGSLETMPFAIPSIRGDRKQFSAWTLSPRHTIQRVDSSQLAREG
jgi:hypothetical protein